MKMKTDEEKIDLIDEDDNVTGQADRLKAGDKLRRSVNVLVFDEDSILVQKRADYKRKNPSRWDIKVAGAVDSLEDYQTAAKRELKEELGIDAPLEWLFNYRYKSKNANHIVGLFIAKYSGDVRPNDEVSEYKWVKVEGLAHELKEDDYCRSSRYLYDNYRNVLFERDAFTNLKDICKKSARLCPWAKKKGLVGYANELILEATEAKEAAESGNIEHLKDELGDVMIDWMHTAIVAGVDVREPLQIAEAKLLRRKPFIMQNKKISLEESRKIWKKVKEEEKA